MPHGVAYVFQPAALEDALDYEAFVPLFINVRNIDIPEKPPVQTVDKVVIVFRCCHCPAKAAGAASIAMPIKRQKDFTTLAPMRARAFCRARKGKRRSGFAAKEESLKTGLTG